LGLDSELKHGPSGSFEVQVDGKTVAKKTSHVFPSEQEILEAVSKVVRA